jgi:hypothetical protein
MQQDCNRFTHDNSDMQTEVSTTAATFNTVRLTEEEADRYIELDLLKSRSPTLNNKVISWRNDMLKK